MIRRTLSVLAGLVLLALSVNASAEEIGPIPAPGGTPLGASGSFTGGDVACIGSTDPAGKMVQDCANLLSPATLPTGLIGTGSITTAITLIGQGASTNVAYLFTPTVVNGRDYAIAGQISAGAAAVGDKVGVYGAAETGSGGSDVWGGNFLAQWKSTNPDSNVQTIQVDFNNNNADATHNPPKLKVAVNVTSGGSFQPGYAIIIDSTNHGANQWHQGIVMVPGAISDTGLNIGMLAYSGSIVSQQISNGGDDLLVQRQTDSSPTGFFIRAVDNANTFNIFQLTTTGVMNIGPNSVANEYLHVALPAASNSGTGNFLALGVENSSTASSVNKAVSISFYGRDTGNTQKLLAQIQAVPGNSNDTAADTVFNSRTGDVTAEAFRILGLGGARVSGHFLTKSTVPVLSACGTSPTINASSTDNAGQVTEGTTATGCVITFGTAYVSTPWCVVGIANVAPATSAMTYSVSNAAITVVNASATGDVINYVCMGETGG
jgi:hypothetical protein